MFKRPDHIDIIDVACHLSIDKLVRHDQPPTMCPIFSLEEEAA